MADTLKLWNMFKSGKHKAIISNITLDEIYRCKDEKLSELIDFLNQIEYSIVRADNEVLALAGKFIDFGVLRQKSFDDCAHIAAAIVNDCDIIVSWNFKHIVNYKTIKGVKVVSTLEGYKDVLIYSPTILVEGEYEDE